MSQKNTKQFAGSEHCIAAHTVIFPHCETLLVITSLKWAELAICLGKNNVLGNAAGRGPSGVNGSTVQIGCALYHGADKSLARPGWKQATTSKL